MANTLPPFPVGADPTSYAVTNWYTNLTNYINSVSGVPWANIDKAGSNLTDLATRLHSNLQGLVGSADLCHVSNAQYAFLNIGPVASGGAAPAGGTGTAAGGWDTAAHRDATITLINTMRTALIAKGILS